MVTQQPKDLLSLLLQLELISLLLHSAGGIQIDGFSGDYGDLDNAPTIGDATLQILDKDANAVATFTANQDGAGTNYQLDYDDLDNQPSLENVAVTDGSQLQFGNASGTDDISILGAGDVTVTHADGSITISSTSKDINADGGLVDDLGPGNDEIGITPGSSLKRVLVWKEAGGVTAFDDSSVSGNSSITADGTYADVPTTGGTGAGLRISFDLSAGDGTVSNVAIADPGEGYSTSDVITAAAGHDFTITVTTVTTVAKWEAVQNQNIAEGPINPSNGVMDNIFMYNGRTINSDYTIRQGLNAMSAGPITIINGVTVTIGNGESWAIV